MVNEKNVCKVCGNDISLSDRYCPVCKFEQRIYPSVIPKEYADYEEERIRIATIQWREFLQMKDKFRDIDSYGNKEKPVAFLVVRQSLHEQVYALYEGKNTFGCKRGGIEAPNHQKIKILDDALQANHFSIIINSKEGRYTLEDNYQDNASWCIKDVKTGRQKHSLISGDILQLGELRMSFYVS